MTKDEKATFDELKQLTSQLLESNRQLVKELNERVAKTESIYRPVSLESDILTTIQTATQQSILKVLTDYNSPLVSLTKSVVESHQAELRKMIDEAFVEVIRKDDFKDAIREAFSHKVARTIISNNNSIFEKVSNELKQDPVFKAKLIAATANVVNECLNQSN